MNNMKVPSLFVLYALAVLAAILVTICIAGIAAFISACIAGSIYDYRHAIPDPVERGDDLGGGLVVIFWATIAFICAMPLVIPLSRFFSKKFRKFIVGDHNA